MKQNSKIDDGNTIGRKQHSKFIAFCPDPVITEDPHMIRKFNSNDSVDLKKSYCQHVCEAIPLIFKNFKLKMLDHLLLGGEHNIKISTGFNSPIKPNFDEEISSDEKKEIVKLTHSFGMFSLFKYHLKRGYKNRELKKSNKIFCSHIFSLIFALPILIFIGQWFLFIALVIHEINRFDGNICKNTGPFENKIMISGISIVYFARSFFIWDNITNSIK